MLAALYLLTGVPLGGHTVAGHVVRIFETDEARELGREVKAAGDRADRRVRREMGTLARTGDVDQP